MGWAGVFRRDTRSRDPASCHGRSGGPPWRSPGWHHGPMAESVRVALVVEPLRHRVPGGTGVATAALARELSWRPDVTLVPLLARHGRGSDPAPLGESQAGAIAYGLPRVLLYESWSRTGRPRLPRRAPAVDVLHSPMLPAPDPQVPLVVTLHDMAFVTRPGDFPVRALRLYRRMWSRLVGRADRVLCSSERTLALAVDAGLSTDVARVVPLGAEVERPGPDEVARRLSGLGLDRGRRFVLSVGTAEPRKNLSTVVGAFAALAGRDPEIELVLVGPRGWKESLGDHLAGLPESVAARVRAPGRVPDQDLAALYEAASVFCYPSFDEGFGLPVLEAMAHGTPVVTSVASAMAEVGGDAVLGVDPTSLDEVVGALESVLGSPQQADAMAVSGLARAEDYSWERSAQLTVDVYRELI